MLWLEHIHLLILLIFCVCLYVLGKSATSPSVEGMVYVDVPWSSKAQSYLVTRARHSRGVPYMDYVKKISANALATKVKLADLRHNSDLSRLDVVDSKALVRVEKYAAAIQLLESVAC